MLTRCSSDLRYRFVSRACAQMFGREPKDFRETLHAAVTPYPTAEWAAQRIVEWCARDLWPPRFLIHDRDSHYGATFECRLRHVGIEQVRTPFRAPPHRVRGPIFGFADANVRAAHRRRGYAHQRIGCPTRRMGFSCRTIRLGSTNIAALMLPMVTSIVLVICFRSVNGDGRALAGLLHLSSNPVVPM